MIKKKKKSSDKDTEQKSNNILIISGKTYKINELNYIFNYKNLRFCDNKEKLLQYWYLAIESGVKEFIYNVDRVFNENFSKYD